MSKRMLPALAALVFPYVLSAGCTLVVERRLDDAALPCSADNLEMETHDWTHGTCTIVPGDRLRLSMLDAPSGGKVYVVPKIGGQWLTDGSGTMSVLTYDSPGTIDMTIPYLDVAPGTSVEFLVFDALPSRPSDAERMRPAARISFSYSHLAALLSSDGHAVTVAEITAGGVGWHREVTLPVTMEDAEMVRDPSGRYLVMGRRVSGSASAVPMLIMDLLNPDDVSELDGTAGLGSVSFPDLTGAYPYSDDTRSHPRYPLVSMSSDGEELLAWSPDGTAAISLEDRTNSIVRIHGISPEVAERDGLYAMVWSSGTTLTLGAISDGSVTGIREDLWNTLQDVNGTCELDAADSKDGSISEVAGFAAPFVHPMAGYLVFLSSMTSSDTLVAGVVSDTGLLSRMQQLSGTKEGDQSGRWCFPGVAPRGSGPGDWRFMSLEWATSGGAPFAVSGLVPSNGGLSGNIVVFGDGLRPMVAHITTSTASQKVAHPVFMGCLRRSGWACLPVFSYIIPGASGSNYIRVDVTENPDGEIVFGNASFRYRAAGPVTVPFGDLSFLHESADGRAVLLGVGPGGLYEVDSLLLNDGKPDNDTDGLVLEGDFSRVSCHP